MSFVGELITLGGRNQFDSGFGVWGLGFKVQGLGFKV